ncbi:bifunctional alpha,alpha-trehalose-phosphate synthase (UDP-forming)/trehalose-phosphatase [Adhaeribacter rhizoryzae]|uniref:Alpha,alpha-trehalose-phosphate synthase n=1 Tax=Adhaeribacter rhizoryzae TaxID=2607907 RepID=A0A5M6CZU7_9BACT|nr:bifunctional alpha,alpha-trehalose-phosphate synthase (UDP-forming)/trehalose-phosphatase [Adhaeribacter rhizoryzae]KAA5540613.1 bifunctional alpha,alpha-trehalose-phosphate synthase (UDP-forming)/trehalose-phosphatase [Adhaeribacter rhizoryzae]
MARKIIVSNRLPVKVRRADGTMTFEPSEGGLATGLGSVYKEGENIWLGWPGLCVEESEEQQVITELQKERMQPVFLTESDIKEYYEGFSNETLWPTFHYFSQFAVYEQSYWEAYYRVNQKFCEQIVKFANPDDTIWIHDYQLLLLPSMVRESLPDSTIGFFQHIPFPSYEVFRMLPWRKQILQGLLGADLIGFHTYDDVRHFVSSVIHLVGLAASHGIIETGNRSVMVDAFPMGIDYDKYAQTANSEKVSGMVQEFQEALRHRKIILSIDRLDYSKGIPQRLRAFEMFLKQYPEFHEQVTLIMIVVPSRDQVEKYKELKIEVDELVGRINGLYRTLSWAPVQYYYHSFPFEELSAFYRMAHVALVTPMRDGMNLVCKEYIASRNDGTGVLILSEMAGAAKELSEAILINPNDVHQMVGALQQALIVPEENQRVAVASMQATVQKYNIHHWVNLFMDRLTYAKEKQNALKTTLLKGEVKKQLINNYQQAQQRLIFLDYDGTLMPFTRDPNKTQPDEELLHLLQTLAAEAANRVVIISGRDHKTLAKWLGHLPIDMIAEHGVWLRKHETEWRMIQNLDNSWKEDIRPIFEMYVSRTPGTLLEEKDFALVWHYRKVDPVLGETRAGELSSHLNYLIANRNLQVMEGDKIVEIKNIEVNKGIAASRWLHQYGSDFVLAIGDDRTDEDTFRVMPKDAYTIKVGNIRSIAKYHVQSPQHVRELLRQLVNGSAQ